MATDYPHLRSFQHCKKDIDLVCFRLPEMCPLCGHSTSTGCRIPPFVLTSPLSSSQEAPHSVVLKPTHGDFLRFVNLCLIPSVIILILNEWVKKKIKNKKKEKNKQRINGFD